MINHLLCHDFQKEHEKTVRVIDLNGNLVSMAAITWFQGMPVENTSLL